MSSGITVRWIAAGGLVFSAACLAQQPIGALPTDAAKVAGLVSVSGGTATIQNNGTVTAGPRTAAIALHRGGAVDVCATSIVHLSQSSASVENAPLLVAVERGAAEMRWGAQRADVIMTPDLRLELSEAAPLDLRLRVIANGDTCIENAGKRAPLIHVTEQFGAGGYLLKPEQRVLFEHGSVREVVDTETAGCGCPAVPVPLLSADGKPAKGGETNAFPEAVSAGLEQPSVPQAAPGDTHVQVATRLAYNGKTNTVAGPPEPKSVNAPPVRGAATVSSSAAAPAARQPVDVVPPPSGPKPLHAIGRFFRRLFGGKA